MADASDQAGLILCIARQIQRAVGVQCEVGLWLGQRPTVKLTRNPKLVGGAPDLLDEELLGALPELLDVLASGQPLLVPSAAADSRNLGLARFKHHAANAASLAYVPVSAPHGALGVIAASRTDGQAVLSEVDVRLLQHLAERAGMAIEHGRALTEARRELDERRRMTERLRAVAQASRDFAAATSDYRKLLDVVARTVGTMLGDLCSIRMISRDGQWLRAEDASIFHADARVAEAFRQAMQANPQGADQGLAGEVVRSGKALVMQVESSDELAGKTMPSFLALLDKVEIRSLLLLPLLSHDRCFGLLTLSRGRGWPPFDADDLQLAQDLADRAALAAENAALLVDLQAQVHELGKAERRFRQLLESAPDALVLVDRERRLVLVNAKTERLFGYTRDELIGQPFELLVLGHTDPQQPLLRDVYFEPVDVQADVSTGREVFGLRKDGSRFAAEITLNPIETGDGRFVTALIRDATERKRLEEVKARTRELEAENRRANEASRLKSEFLANMSHELRTPLNAVIGFSALLHAGKAGALSPTQVEYLGDILTSSRHLLQLINDVLDLAKIEAGRLDVRPEPVDLLRLTSEVRDILRGLATDKGVSISVDVDEQLEGIVTDPRIFKQILYNYLSNAIKFTQAAGTIRVSIEAASEKKLVVRVSDTGVGIRQEDLGSLFQEFRQLEYGADRKHPGTGLGLALTKRIVEAQGGTVAVDSVLGRGSVFSAELPRFPG